MKTIKQISDMIELQSEVQEKLLLLQDTIATEEVNRWIPLLTEVDKWVEARLKLKELLVPDEKGFKMLLCMLQAAAYSYEKYESLGISEKIFIDTMKCFTRFVAEHKVSFGYYGFDRDFWTGRQLSLLLFRVGELEVEKRICQGEKTVAVHIPSDAKMTRENCITSFKQAKELFEKCDKEYVDVPYTCHSWLLSPVLKELLPENSRIIQFQNMFEIVKVEPENTDYMEWVFKSKDIPLAQLPEDTSLQRAMKKHLLNGGWIGAGEGIIV